MVDRASPFILILSLAALVFSSGCSTYSAVGKEYRNSRTRLRVPLPAGWLRYRPARNEYVLTRDGLLLEQISIRLSRIGKKLPRTKRVYTSGMLAHEIAELSLGVLDAHEDTKNFKIEEIALATLAGLDGYVANARYATPDGLPMRLRLYGAMIGDYVCEIEYAAADDVYYDRYLPVFETLVSEAAVGD